MLLQRRIEKIVECYKEVEQEIPCKLLYLNEIGEERRRRKEREWENKELQGI
jgi:hypothetical protein